MITSKIVINDYVDTDIDLEEALVKRKEDQLVVKTKKRLRKRKKRLLLEKDKSIQYLRKTLAELENAFINLKIIINNRFIQK